jgi:hypothetical protein
MTAHLIAGNKTDLEVGLGYLNISNSIKRHGEIRQARGVYVSTVLLARPFTDVAQDLKSRFGRFVQLRRT